MGFTLCNLCGYTIARIRLYIFFHKIWLTLISDLAYPVGLIALLIGLVGLLQNISNRNALPIALAMAHVPLIYAAIGHGIACGGRRDLSETDSSPVRKLLGTIIFLALTLWAALTACLINKMLLVGAGGYWESPHSVFCVG